MTYPRPQLVREAWLPLEGEWEFALDHDATWRSPAEVTFGRTIRVPYAPEAPRSGVHDEGMYLAVWYRRRVAVPPGRSVLRFGAVDHQATVYVDGALVATHEGGYTPFAVDLSPFAGGEHELAVRAYDDPRDREKPRGKQDWEPEPHAIWYPRTTGIWQPVWVEPLADAYLESLHWWSDREPAAVRIRARVAGDADGLVVRLSAAGATLAELELAIDHGAVRGRIDLRAAPDLRWTPERPTLIDAELTLMRGVRAVDRVRSYTAIREVGTRDGAFTLNGEPYALRFALDQGYWPDGGLSATDDELRADVELAKALGLNGVRKHQKLEDPRWLAHCDRLGLLVWEELPSAYVWSETAAMRLHREWAAAIERDRDHPCIVAWVPFNESWGVPDIARSERQRDLARDVHSATRALDPSRPVSANDGWETIASEIIGVHDYAKDPATLRGRWGTRDAVRASLAEARPAERAILLDPYADQPVVLSEFGGVALEGDSGWGYDTVRADEFAGRVAALWDAARSDGLAGACYTQLTDTYQERNGLVRMDRTPKAPLERLRAAITGTG